MFCQSVLWRDSDTSVGGVKMYLQLPSETEAIAREPGKVYLHCYLGVHRIKVVQELLHEMGKDTATDLPDKQ